MKRYTLKICVVSLLGLTLLACERDHRKPAFMFFPEMVESVPYDSFAPNANHKDGKTLQRPVKGTVPRGFLPYPFPEDRERAAKELKNILPNTKAVVARGQHYYEAFCLPCHGVMGKGDGPLIPKYPNPPSFTAKSMRHMPEGEIYHVITMGSGQMAPYATQIDPEDRWAIVRYVQVLQKAGRPTGQPEAQEEVKASPQEVIEGGL